MLIPAIFALVFTLMVVVMVAGAEIAIGTISRDSLEKLMDNKVRGARPVHALTRNRRRFHLAFLCGRVLSTAIVVVLAVYIARQLVVLPSIHGIVVLTGALIASTVLLVIGEGVVARLIAMGEYEDTLPRFSTFFLVVYWCLFPLTSFLDWVLSRFIRKSAELAAKEDALLEFVKSESEAGVIEREEKDMIQGVLDFFDTTVKEVMVPRIDVVAVDRTTPMPELIELFKTKGHSRIPVFDGRIDSIAGVVYAKDILPAVARDGVDAVSITDTLRKAYYVHESKKCSVLLKEFKKAKVHLAVVVDEYGGTAGIVALEDLLEEIVGEIQDEYDRDERDFFWINNKTVLMDAGLDIDDVNEIIHSDIPRDDFDTLAGFIYHQLGVIPEGGEEFEWNRIVFTIKEIDGNRISKVLVRLEEPLIRSVSQHG